MNLFCCLRCYPDTTMTNDEASGTKMSLGPLPLPPPAGGLPVNYLTDLLQMNLLMKRKNIRTLRMRWTRRSQNCQDSKCGKLVGANTVLGRACVPTDVWAGLITLSTPVTRPRPSGLTWLTAETRPHTTTTTITTNVNLCSPCVERWALVELELLGVGPRLSCSVAVCKGVHRFTFFNSSCNQSFYASCIYIKWIISNI